MLYNIFIVSAENSYFALCQQLQHRQGVTVPTSLASTHPVYWACVEGADRYLQEILDDPTRVDCWRSPLVARQDGSTIHGVGLIARMAIAPNVLVAIKPGHILTGDEVAEAATIIKNSHQQIGPDKFLATKTPLEVDQNLVGYNHSCQPNARVIVPNGFNLAVLVTKIQIDKGEEVTVDYGVSFDSDTQAIAECQCGAPNCRHQIRPSVDWTNEDFQQRNMLDFPEWMREKIRRSREQPAEPLTI